MELVKECRKGKVAIVLSTVDSEMMEASSVLLAGSLPEQAIAFSELFEKFKEGNLLMIVIVRNKTNKRIIYWCRIIFN